MRGEVIGLAVIGLLLSGCAGLKTRPALTEEMRPIVKKDLDELQIDLIVQMEAFIEEVRDDNKNMRASIRRLVSECLCPSEMK